MVMMQACGLFWGGGGEHFFEVSLRGGEAFLHGNRGGAKSFLANFCSHRGSRNIAKYYSIYNQIRQNEVEVVSKLESFGI